MITVHAQVSGDTLYFYAITHRFDTGALTDADAVPSYRIYRQEDGTAVANGSMAKLDDANTTGFYSEALSLAGYDPGEYVVYITAAVNSVTGGATPQVFSVGQGGGATLVRTTIATLASQTSFTLTGGPADDNALNRCLVVIRDSVSVDQVAVGLISAYTGATKTVTLAADPGVFTVAAGDFVEVLAVPRQLPNAEAEAAGGLYTRGTGAGQINQDANGRIDANLRAIIGTALTETSAGYLAAAFKKFLDVAAPVLTAASVDQTGDAFARVGLAGAGLTALGDARVANLDAAVSTRSTYAGDDTAGTTTLLARLTALRAAALDYLDAAISTRLATAGYTAPPSAAAVRSEVDANSTQLAAIAAYVDDLESRLTAVRAAKLDSLTVTVAGAIDANVTAISGATAGAAALDRSARGIVRGTAGAGASATSVPTSSLDPAAAVADQFKGRVVIFDRDTATAALRGQATDITASTAAGVLTVTALTTAPASGDTFVVV